MEIEQEAIARRAKEIGDKPAFPCIRTSDPMGLGVSMIPDGASLGMTYREWLVGQCFDYDHPSAGPHRVGLLLWEMAEIELKEEAEGE